MSAAVQSTAKNREPVGVEVVEDELPGGGSKDVAFIELIRGEREENPIDVYNGLRVIQLTEAAWKSAETGMPVKVDLS